jgi:ABC-2 type transport system permease protein
VVYPVDRIGGVLGRVLALNPVTTIIDAYRDVLLRGTLPPAGPLLTAAVLSAILLMTAWALFHRGELAFAENI